MHSAMPETCQSCAHPVLFAGVRVYLATGQLCLVGTWGVQQFP